jgi:SNF2 family DNA or RNA helicase
MGLGKTLTMLSLIVKTKAAAGGSMGLEEIGEAERIRSRNLNGMLYVCGLGLWNISTIFSQENYKLVKSNATLVIAPASLIYQWEREVKDRIKPGKLKVLVFHGPKQQRIRSAYRYNGSITAKMKAIYFIIQLGSLRSCDHHL